MDTPCPIGIVKKSLAIPHHKVKPIVPVRINPKVFKIYSRRIGPGEEIGDQHPSGGGILLDGRWVPVIGKGGQTPLTGYAHPCPAALKIQTAENLGVVFPK